ncbi:MAG: hypothetical protein HKN82_04225 [Akkermansiaceae bacterium]|nr:hypothetical protein [Akkermansiaceae bacterium]
MTDKPSKSRTLKRSPGGGIDSGGEPGGNLRHITTGELRRAGNTRLTEMIAAKLHTLDDKAFMDRQVRPKVRVLLELLRDTLAGRYPHLSVAAFAEILLAMDYFLEVRDEIPDTQDRGLEDDYRRITAAWDRHDREIAGYQGWRILAAARGE